MLTYKNGLPCVISKAILLTENTQVENTKNTARHAPFWVNYLWD